MEKPTNHYQTAETELCRITGFLPAESVWVCSCHFNWPHSD